MRKRPLVSVASETSEKPNPEGCAATAVANANAPAPGGTNGGAAEQPEMLTYIGLSRMTGLASPLSTAWLSGRGPALPARAEDHSLFR